MRLSKPLNPAVQLRAGDGDAPPILVSSFDEVDEIGKLRAKIDEIDAEIIRLLEERTRVARQIGLAKVHRGLPIRDESRETEVLKRAGKYRRVFEAILEVSRDVQRL